MLGRYGFGTFQAHHTKPDSVSVSLNPVLMFLSFSKEDKSNRNRGNRHIETRI